MNHQSLFFLEPDRHTLTPMSHSADGSTKVIVFALFANFGIAISKFIGAYITKSASMLAEAIHSVVDCSNQVLLLIGKKKSQQAPDEQHPLGYGRESFFWSFIVAIMLFSMGGLFAIYEGVHKLQSDEPIRQPLIACSILVFGIILETFSFWACYKEVKKQNRFGSLWVWLKRSTSADLLVIFLEDAAALLGLIVALVALLIGWVTGNPIWDAVGSISVGVVLVGVAVMLATETKSLLIGESPSTDYRKSIEKSIVELFPGGRILNLIAIQTGGDEVMISFKFYPGESTSKTTDLIDRMNQMERNLKATYPEVRWLFVEPDSIA